MKLTAEQESENARINAAKNERGCSKAAQARQRTISLTLELRRAGIW
ncbi:MAG: hypothetical protein ACLRL4_00015 [Bifidobacterium bifidum]